MLRPKSKEIPGHILCALASRKGWGLNQAETERFEILREKARKAWCSRIAGLFWGKNHLKENEMRRIVYVVDMGIGRAGKREGLSTTSL